MAGYALVLALVAAKTVKDRDGSRLGAYFALVPGIWAMEILLLLVIAAYVAGLLILTSQRAWFTRRILPIGIGFGAATAGVLYALAPLGVNISLKWWGLVALSLPLATGFLAARLSARDTRRAALHPTGQACLAASCAMAAAALLLAVLTSVTIALFPQHVPLQFPPPPPGGGCETCNPNQVVIPPGLRHEYWVELSVGQADMAPLAALMIAPFFGAWLGILGGGLARTSPGTRRRGGSGPQPDALPQRPAGLMASDADREKVAGVLRAGFAGGRLTKEELDLRLGQTLAARTYAGLAALTADLPAGRPSDVPVRMPVRAHPRPPADRAVVWGAFGLITPALLAPIFLSSPGSPPAGNHHVGLILFMVAVVYFTAWLLVGAQMLRCWPRQRSRPGAGQDLTEPSSPALGE